MKSKKRKAPGIEFTDAYDSPSNQRPSQSPFLTPVPSPSPFSSKKATGFFLVFNIHSRTSDAAFCQPTAALNIDVGIGRSDEGEGTVVSCAKHAVVCRLHNNNSARATSNLQRIKGGSSSSTYGSLAVEPDGPKPRRVYGALKGPSPASAASSLMRRWSTVRGIIEDSSNSTTLRQAYPCRPPTYCLHSSRLLHQQPPQMAHHPPAAAAAATEDQAIYPALCPRHRSVCSSSSQQTTGGGCSQAAAAANRLSNPPDVIVSPEAEAFYCSAPTDRRFVVLDWRMTQEAAAVAPEEVEEEEEEEENALSCDVIDAENTAAAAETSSDLRMTSHDAGSTKTTLSEQMDNDIL